MESVGIMDDTRNMNKFFKSTYKVKENNLETDFESQNSCKDFLEYMVKKKQ